MKKRSKDHIRRNMLAVKSKGSKIEKLLGKELWANNFRYRKHYVNLPGKPDFVLIKYKIAIFCDSDFWHGYNWNERKYDHKSNIDFWHKKIEQNIERDKRVNLELKNMGWKVIRIWEHEIKSNLERCLQRIKILVK